MVDGVYGDLDDVVRHVVVDYGSIVECVIILNLHVEEKIVMVLEFIPTKTYATTFAVQVKLSLLIVISSIFIVDYFQQCVL